MSRTNKHRINRQDSLSVKFMEEELGACKTCPKRSCKGRCIPVITRYYDHEPLNHEYECTTCGKVIQDHDKKEERERHWKKEREKRWKGKKRHPSKHKRERK